MKQLAVALLPSVGSTGDGPDSSGLPIELHTGPLLKDFSVKPSRALPVCESFQSAIDTLIALESKVPRILWIRWLTTAARLWLPLFFLRRCAVTASAAQLAKSTITNGRVLNPVALT